MTTSQVLLKAERVSRVYLTPGGAVQALQDVSLEICKGTLVALKGRSGSGKTTLLNILGGLDRPSSGEVIFDSERLNTLDDEALTHLRCACMGFVFQSFALLPTYSAFENVEFALRLAGNGVRESRERALQCLHAVGLANRRNSRPDELSGGQQQRVAIARALVNSPALVLADEPTGALDSQSARSLLRLLRGLCQERGQTFVIVTHDPVVGQVCDRIYQMQDGRVLSTATGS